MADAARLAVALADLVAFFEGNIAEHSITTLNTFKEKKQYAEYLDLVESFGECMAFVDHNKLSELLCSAWDLYMDVLNVERKNLKKKLGALRDDKKTDPDVLAKAEGNFEDFCVRRATAVANVKRFQVMKMMPLKYFKDPAFDAMAKYKEVSNA